MRLTYSQLFDRYVQTDFRAESRTSIINGQIENSLENLIAIYDPHNRRIVIDRSNFVDYVERLTARDNSTEQAAMTVLFHELVHAADDERYDFRAMRQRDPWNSLERSAVIEGHAQQITELPCEQHDCAGAFADDEYYLSYLPALTGTAKLLPTMRGDNIALKYVQGAKFLRALKKMEDGSKLVDQALRAAPADILTLFDTERYLDESIRESSHRLAETLLSTDTKWLSNWIEVPKAAFTQSRFPRDSERRSQYVNKRVKVLLGSAMSSYYHPDDRSLLPVTIKLMEVKRSEHTDPEAELMHREVRRKSAGLLGSSLSLRDIETWLKKSEFDGETVTKRHFRAKLVNLETDKITSYWVTTISFRNMIAEISLFKTAVVQYKTIELVEELLKKHSFKNTPAVADLSDS